jgi:hypothetical protein
MSDVAENIPTLTDIVQAGDESMLNHFDAHQFDDAQIDNDENTQEQSHAEDSEYDMQNIMEVSDIFENTTTFESNTSEPEEIPSIKLDNEQHEYVEDEDFSDAMQLMSEDDIENEPETLLSEANPFDRDILKEKINQAVKEILPSIEEQLKKQLYKQLDL